MEFGLASKVVPADQFDEVVSEWATKLASKSPVLMRLGHDATYRQQDMALDDALEFLRPQLTLTFSTEDIQEGVKAFFESANRNGRGADGGEGRDASRRKKAPAQGSRGPRTS